MAVVAPLWSVVVISHTLRVRIKFMGKYGWPPLALAGLLVLCVVEECP